MDTELARTFLAVAAHGNFVAAAQRLHVTQSTVSARVLTLETQLGATLFQRGRHGAELTPAGKRFLKHAKHLVRTVELARHDVGLPLGFSDVLALSGRIALWEGFLPHWVDWMRRAAPDVSLRLDIGFEADIMQGLIEGSVDVGVMYTPTSRTGLTVEPLFDETLLLVGDRADRPWPDPDYIHIDWGAEFHARFSEIWSDVPPPALTANIGWLGVQQILAFGGSGYFPARLVRGYLADGRLHRLPASPELKLSAWMVFPHDRESTTLATALTGLRELAQDETLIAARG
jgi:DNA-binding transcriptional LysR family regulator